MLKPHNHLSSSADNSVSRFAMAYRNEAAALEINLTDIYAAMKADGEGNPLERNTEGCQVNV
ncbi:glycoside hydrolase family 92 protein [Athelia psychrophila]|uniref:Glycoside hydrolase family 92 protein n=1 Tax=Athelia psychrophila TaxID=1759441 RepID=A0A166F6W5_9AGAM|nr:glycoside hydrolase family 92 protein [Fibularhizoctonia sp. CBS 109695]